MRQVSALFMASILYTVFFLSIDSKFATDFMHYLTEN